MSTFKCHVCGGETATDEFASEVLEVDGRRVLVEHIPARVCTRCGEAAFSRETTERIRPRDEQDQEILKDNMKVTYDPEVDVLRIVFRDVAIEESDEDKPGVILDYDKEGNIVGLEVLNASQRVENPRGVDYAVTG